MGKSRKEITTVGIDAQRSGEQPATTWANRQVSIVDPVYTAYRMSSWALRPQEQPLRIEVGRHLDPYEQLERSAQDFPPRATAYLLFAAALPRFCFTLSLVMRSIKS